MRLRSLTAAAALSLGFACSLGLGSLALSGCSRLPGAKAAQETYTRPDQITDFHTLFAQNCQACHGANGQNGPAIDLANPEYQALIDDASLRKWIANGMPGTEMPAFAQSAGGMLTDNQVDALVAGMRKEWSNPGAFAGATPPPYPQDQTGHAQHGQQAYQTRCASCHQNPSRQQVTSPVYLSLVSDQALRDIIVAGESRHRLAPLAPARRRRRAQWPRRPCPRRSHLPLPARARPQRFLLQVLDLPWPCRQFPRRRNPPRHLQKPLHASLGRRDRQRRLLGPPRRSQPVQGFRHQLRPPRLPRPLVPAVAAFHVPLPRRRLLR
jgi:mono/diheme cytochrome c family protein